MASRFDNKLKPVKSAVRNGVQGRIVSVVCAQAASVTGSSSPLGATIVPDGVNFSVFSHGATAVDLLLFDREDDPRPARVIPLDSLANRTYHYWHTFVPGLQPEQLYGYRVHGPFD